MHNYLFTELVLTFSLHDINNTSTFGVILCQIFGGGRDSQKTVATAWLKHILTLSVYNISTALASQGFLLDNKTNYFPSQHVWCYNNCVAHTA